MGINILLLLFLPRCSLSITFSSHATLGLLISPPSNLNLNTGASEVLDSPVGSPFAASLDVRSGVAEAVTIWEPLIASRSRCIVACVSTKGIAMELVGRCIDSSMLLDMLGTVSYVVAELMVCRINDSTSTHCTSISRLLFRDESQQKGNAIE
jgi:hypothetical protein